MDEFYYVPPLRNVEDATLARLYREARSSNNVYLGLLFYWHSLVYPSTDDRAAVDYINRLWKRPPRERSCISDSIERILQKPLFSPTHATPVSLGDYLREGIRNSIAHIVRNRPNSRSLQLDLLSELRHLNDAKDVLHYCSRHRLKNERGMNEPHDLEIFRYFSP
ncbi:MAG: methylamine utilization protein MauJ [Anaerolineae bacterium]